MNRLSIFCTVSLISFGTITCTKNDVQPFENYIELDSEKIEIVEVNLHTDSKACKTTLKLFAENEKKKITLSGYLMNCSPIPKDCEKSSNGVLIVGKVSILYFDSKIIPQSVTYSIPKSSKIQYCSYELSSFEKIYVRNENNKEKTLNFKFIKKK